MNNTITLKNNSMQIIKGLGIYNKSIGYYRRNLNTTRIPLYLFDSSSGGSGGLNKLNERERAKENMFIRKLEREQLVHIKEEIKKHKEELAKLEYKINELSKKQGDSDSTVG